MAGEGETLTRADDGVTFETLVDQLGRGAAEEFFERVDPLLRDGRVIHGTNVRESRTVSSKARHQGQAQLVVPGRSGKRRGGQVHVGDSVVIINMDDLGAVVRAGRAQFDWVDAFAPRGGLPAATNGAKIVQGSRGRRQLHG